MTTVASRTDRAVGAGWVRLRALGRHRLSVGEVALYAGVLAVATAALLGEHISKSGFYSDDWAYAAGWANKSREGFWHAFSYYFHAPTLQGRPTLAVYISLVQEAFGSHWGRHLAWAAVLAVVFSTSVYVLLRILRFRPLDAGLIGLLLLVFPGSDSTRIWAMISDAQVAMSLALLGVACSLASLSAGGKRRWTLRVGGLVLVALGVTTYELTFVALLLAPILYRTRVPWRRVLREGALDWVVLGLIYTLVVSHSSAQRLPFGAAVDHGWSVMKQVVTLFGTIVLPFNSAAAGVIVAALTVAAAVAVIRMLPRGDPARLALRRWLLVIAIAIVMIAGAYVIYAPSTLWYEPLAPGLLNRTNAFGALPLLTVVYALGSLLGILFFRGLSRARFLSAAFAATIAFAVGIDYTTGMVHDLKLWDSAWARAHATLVSFRHRAPTVRSNSLIVFFGQPIQETLDIPVWAHIWDLDGALQLAYHDSTVRGRPAFPGTRIVCGATTERLMNVLYPSVALPTDAVPYGYLYLYDTRSGALAIPRNQAECQKALPGFVPGPWVATDPGAWDPS